MRRHVRLSAPTVSPVVSATDAYGSVADRRRGRVGADAHRRAGAVRDDDVAAPQVEDDVALRERRRPTGLVRRDASDRLTGRERQRQDDRERD